MVFNLSTLASLCSICCVALLNLTCSHVRLFISSFMTSFSSSTFHIPVCMVSLYHQTGCNSSRDKSHPLPIFGVCLFVCLFWRRYMEILAHNRSKQLLWWTRSRDREGQDNQTFIKPVCLLATADILMQRNQRTQRKYRILRRQIWVNILPGMRIHSFWLFFFF